MPTGKCAKSNNRTRLLASAAFTLAATALGLGSAEAATKVGWAWANEPSSASYTPSTGYSYNSSGGGITISRSSTGVYLVTFTGLGSSLTDNVLVTAYETSGYCQVGSWGASAGGDASVTVRCYDAAGAAADQYYDIVYQAHSGDIGTSTKGLAFLWADQPSSASYTPSSSYQYNSTGATNTMTRSSTGVYTAHLPGLDKVGGHVQVTAYGSAPHRCKTSGWSSDASGTDVNVLCFDATGAAADSYFTLEYSRHLPAAFLTTSLTKGYYAWASQPANPSYTTSGPYTYNAWGTGKLTAVRDGQGQYHLDVEDPGGYSTSNVLVTAYGTDNSYCNSNGWTPVYVACFRQGGDPINSRFDASFLTH